jgi:hypothetical protein
LLNVIVELFWLVSELWFASDVIDNDKRWRVRRPFTRVAKRWEHAYAIW